jgi:ferric-dicitrate binding protein FerR (iron transport regulator)
MPLKETVALKMKTISASPGSKNHFMLPDGSRVWLNAGTTLTYPATFYDDSVRRVTLSGEAFFEITHDENHPFVIHTERMDIRDIGTAFNVKAYPGEQIAEATLIEGSIEVKLKKSDHYTVLNTPNEKVTVYSKESKTSVTADAKQLAETADLSLVLSKARQNPTDTLLAETAWLDDVLMFSNETFEDLAVKMERWYDVKIRFNSDELRKRRFTGAFSNETVTQALQEIQLMKPFNYEIENGTITISD